MNILDFGNKLFKVTDFSFSVFYWAWKIAFKTTQHSKHRGGIILHFVSLSLEENEFPQALTTVSLALIDGLGDSRWANCKGGKIQYNWKVLLRGTEQERNPSRSNKWRVAQMLTLSIIHSACYFFSLSTWENMLHRVWVSYAPPFFLSLLQPCWSSN